MFQLPRPKVLCHHGSRQHCFVSATSAETFPVGVLPSRRGDPLFHVPLGWLPERRSQLCPLVGVSCNAGLVLGSVARAGTALDLATERIGRLHVTLDLGYLSLR